MKPLWLPSPSRADLKSCTQWGQPSAGEPPAAPPVGVLWLETSRW